MRATDHSHHTYEDAFDLIDAFDTKSSQSTLSYFPLKLQEQLELVFFHQKMLHQKFSIFSL